MHTKFLSLCAAALASAVPFVAHADVNPLGFYVGAGVGQSSVNIDSVGFSENPVGWKVMAGVRPLSVVGAELAYLDFGGPHGTVPVNLPANASVRGETLMALGYLPLPLPALDLYAKLGVDHMQTSYTVYAPTGTPLVHGDTSSNGVAWGFGVQSGEWPVLPLAVRAEYERLNSDQGWQSLASVSLIWKF